MSHRNWCELTSQDTDIWRNAAICASIRRGKTLTVSRKGHDITESLFVAFYYFWNLIHTSNVFELKKLSYRLQQETEFVLCLKPDYWIALFLDAYALLLFVEDEEKLKQAIDKLNKMCKLQQEQPTSQAYYAIPHLLLCQLYSENYSQIILQVSQIKKYATGPIYIWVEVFKKIYKNTLKQLKQYQSFIPKEISQLFEIESIFFPKTIIE